MSTLLPGEQLIYERANGVVYARYSNRPDIERWVVGGDIDSVERATGSMGFQEWSDLVRTAEDNVTLKKQLEKTLILYYTIKDG